MIIIICSVFFCGICVVLCVFTVSVAVSFMCFLLCCVVCRFTLANKPLIFMPIALSVLCAQLTRDLLAIARFLLTLNISQTATDTAIVTIEIEGE